jgi:hypothetical protein
VLTVLSVLRSGGEYTAESVERLRLAVSRHLSVPHVFKCLSDVDVGCERIELKHNWPKWWSKIELFRPGVVTGPTLYLDLDTVLVGSIDKLSSLEHDFSIMKNVWNPWMPGSAVMWFSGKNVPHKVYGIFNSSPDHYIKLYSVPKMGGSYQGDQAFIWDCLDRKVKYLSDSVPELIKSYRKDCLNGVPEGCSMVVFGGKQKPWNVPDEWVRTAYAS